MNQGAPSIHWPSRLGPYKASDLEVVGHLFPRPIAVGVAAAFGRRLYHVTLQGFHVREHGVKPDTAMRRQIGPNEFSTLPNT